MHRLSNGFRAAWRALSAADSRRRRGEGRLAPGRGLKQAWDSQAGPGELSAALASHSPPWARGARRGGGGGSTHRDSGNALLALEGHFDPREGCESPVGAALAWTCRRGHARSLGSPSVSQPGSGLRLTHLHVGPAYLFYLHPGPSFLLSFVLACSGSPFLPLSLPLSFSFYPSLPQKHPRDHRL